MARLHQALVVNTTDVHMVAIFTDGALEARVNPTIEPGASIHTLLTAGIRLYFGTDASEVQPTNDPDVFWVRVKTLI